VQKQFATVRMCVHVCDMTPCVCAHVCDMTHLCVGHSSFVCGPYLWTRQSLQFTVSGFCAWGSGFRIYGSGFWVRELGVRG